MSISTSITWNVTNVNRDLEDDFIISAKYEVSGICTDTYSGATYGPVKEYGEVAFNTSRTGSEIAYNDVTESNVLVWVANALSGITTIGPPEDCVIGVESALKEKGVTDHLRVLYTRAAPKPGATGSGTPWSSEPA